MQPQEGVLIDAESAGRLSQLLRANGLGQISGQWRPDRGDFGYGRTVGVLQTVEVTGAAISGGLYPGKVINWDNLSQSWVDGPACRVREVAGGALVNAKKYSPARLVGVDTSGGVDYLVFQVAAGGDSTLLVGRYQGAALVDVWGAFPKTPISLFSGGTLRLGGLPFGYDAEIAYSELSYLPASESFNVLVRDTVDGTFNYTILKTLVLADCSFEANAGMGQVVKARQVGRGAAWTQVFRALDFLKLVPSTGLYRCILETAQLTSFTTRYGFHVVNCRPYDLSQGNGYLPGTPGPTQAFSYGGGATFPAPGSFSAGTEPVE